MTITLISHIFVCRAILSSVRRLYSSTLCSRTPCTNYWKAIKLHKLILWWPGKTSGLSVLNETPLHTICYSYY